MTTQTSHPTNLAIFYGIVDAAPQRGERAAPQLSAARRRFRNDLRGAAEEYRFQVLSPYGDPFQVQVTATGGVPGYTLLREAQAEQHLRLEGYLTMVAAIDPRFAAVHGEDVAEGRSYRELRLCVTRVSVPTPDEPLGGTGVWLEGTVAEPPQFLRHPHYPELRLARTRLRVPTLVGDPDGLLPPITRPCEVSVAVPTECAGAAGLYRVGNQVRLQGRLDCALQRQRGADVAEKLAALEASWQHTREQLSGQPQELQRAGRAYVHARRAIADAPRAFVLGMDVVLLTGAPLEEEAAQVARQVFVRELVRRRQERAARQGPERVQPVPVMPVIAAPVPASQVEDEVRPMPLAPIRPRRSTPDAAVAPPVAVAEGLISAAADEVAEPGADQG